MKPPPRANRGQHKKRYLFEERFQGTVRTRSTEGTVRIAAKKIVDIRPSSAPPSTQNTKYKRRRLDAVVITRPRRDHSQLERYSKSEAREEALVHEKIQPEASNTAKAEVVEEEKKGAEHDKQITSDKEDSDDEIVGFLTTKAIKWLESLDQARMQSTESKDSSNKIEKTDLAIPNSVTIVKAQQRDKVRKKGVRSNPVKVLPPTVTTTNPLLRQDIFSPLRSFKPQHSLPRLKQGTPERPIDAIEELTPHPKTTSQIVEAYSLSK